MYLGQIITTIEMWHFTFRLVMIKRVSSVLLVYLKGLSTSCVGLVGKQMVGNESTFHVVGEKGLVVYRARLVDGRVGTFAVFGAPMQSFGNDFASTDGPYFQTGKLKLFNLFQGGQVSSLKGAVHKNGRAVFKGLWDEEANVVLVATKTQTMRQIVFFIDWGLVILRVEVHEVVFISFLVTVYLEIWLQLKQEALLVSVEFPLDLPSRRRERAQNTALVGLHNQHGWALITKDGPFEPIERSSIHFGGV